MLYQLSYTPSGRPRRGLACPRQMSWKLERMPEARRERKASPLLSQLSIFSIGFRIVERP